MTRAPDGGASCSAASDASAPATTIWPPPLKLAGSRPSSASFSSSSASSPPSTALMPVSTFAAASAIATPRWVTSFIASCSLRMPAARRRGELTDRVTGDAREFVPAAAVGDRGEAQQRRTRRSAAGRPRYPGSCRRRSPCRGCADRRRRRRRAHRGARRTGVRRARVRGIRGFASPVRARRQRQSRVPSCPVPVPRVEPGPRRYPAKRWRISTTPPAPFADSEIWRHAAFSASGCAGRADLRIREGGGEGSRAHRTGPVTLIVTPPAHCAS